MADREHKGLVARWLEGKERSEDYARSTLPTNRWSLFWDILKSRFGKLMLNNLLMLITFIPLIALIVLRYLRVLSFGFSGPFGSGLGVGYPVMPNITGLAEANLMMIDLIFYGLFILASIVAALGVSGGAYVIRNMIWTEGIFFSNDFLHGIKRNFWNVLEAALIFSATLFLVHMSGQVADWYLTIGTSNTVLLWIAKIVGYSLLIIMGMVCLWMVALGINYQQGPWTLFRNAVVMTLGMLPQTLFFGALALLPVILTLLGNTFFQGVGIVVLLMFGFSYLLLVWLDFSQWAFDRFINPERGYQVGRGLYNKDKSASSDTVRDGALDSAAVREYKRMIVAQGRSKLMSKPIKPIDDGLELYELPDAFSREDLQKLKESKEAMQDGVTAYEEEHKDDARYVEYNKQFDERERALQDPKTLKGGKVKAPKRPKMLNKKR